VIVGVYFLKYKNYRDISVVFIFPPDTELQMKSETESATITVIFIYTNCVINKKYHIFFKKRPTPKIQLRAGYLLIAVAV